MTTPTFAARFHQVTSERFQRLGREFFCIGTGQAATMMGSLIGVRMLTGVLPPEAYGELSLGMTAAVLVNQVIFGPVSQASLRFFAPAREADEFRHFTSALSGLLLWSFAVMAALAVFVCFVLLLTGHAGRIWLALAAFGYALFWGYSTVLGGIQNAARQRAVVAWHNALSTWARFMVAAGMVVWLGVNSAIAMAGYVWASLIVLLSQLWFFKQRFLDDRGSGEGSVECSRLWRSSMVGYAWPFACWGVLTWAQMASSRWALQIFTSTQDVGLYTALYQLGYAPITILTGLMVQLLAPIFFQRAGDASDPSRMRDVYSLNWRLTLWALILASVMSLAAAALHGTVFHLLVDRAYYSVSGLLPLMVLSSGLFAAAQFALISLLSKTESLTLLAPKVVTAALGVLLNFAGAIWLGVPGVVGANLVFSIAYLAWILALVRRRCR